MPKQWEAEYDRIFDPTGAIRGGTAVEQEPEQDDWRAIYDRLFPTGGAPGAAPAPVARPSFGNVRSSKYAPEHLTDQVPSLRRDPPPPMPAAPPPAPVYSPEAAAALKMRHSPSPYNRVEFGEGEVEEIKPAAPGHGSRARPGKKSRDPDAPPQVAHFLGDARAYANRQVGLLQHETGKSLARDPREGMEPAERAQLNALAAQGEMIVRSSPYAADFDKWLGKAGLESFHSPTSIKRITGNLTSAEKQAVTAYMNAAVQGRREAKAAKMQSDAEAHAAKAERLHPIGQEIYRQLKRLEESGGKVDPGVRRAFKNGDITMVVDQIVMSAAQHAAITGDRTQLDAALRVQSMANDRAASDREAAEDAGWFAALSYDVSAMLPGMGKSMVLGVVPVAGPALSAAMWWRQGAGEVLGRVAAEGGDPVESLAAASVAGFSYAMVEQMQIKQFGRAYGMVKAAAARETFGRAAVRAAAGKGKDWAKETFEEVIQDLLLDETVRKELAAQGVEYELDELPDRIMQTIKDVGPSMAVLNLFGGAKSAGHIGMRAMSGEFKEAGYEAGEKRYREQQARDYNPPPMTEAPHLGADVLRAAGLERGQDGKIRDKDGNEVTFGHEVKPEPGAPPQPTTVKPEAGGKVEQFGVKDERGNARRWGEFTGAPYAQPEESPAGLQNPAEFKREDAVGTSGGVEGEDASSGAPMISEGSGGEGGAGDVRAKFDALQTVEVSSEEVRGIPKGQGFVNRVIGWLKQKDTLGEYNNADTGWEIIFNNRSVRNVVNHRAGDGKIALLEYVPDLIENGVFLETTAKRDELDSHIFVAKVNIDGKDGVVGFVVRENSNGKRYYDHAIGIGPEDKNWVGSSLRAHNPAQAESLSTDAKPPKDDNTISGIVRKHLNSGVNTQNKNDVKKDGRGLNMAGKAPQPTSEAPLAANNNIPPPPEKVNTPEQKNISGANSAPESAADLSIREMLNESAKRPLPAGSVRVVQEATFDPLIKLTRDVTGKELVFLNGDHEAMKASDLDVDGFMRGTGEHAGKIFILESNRKRALLEVVAHEFTHFLQQDENSAIRKDLHAALRMAGRKDAVDELTDEHRVTYKGLKEADLDDEVDADIVGSLLTTEEAWRTLEAYDKNTFERVARALYDILAKMYKAIKESFVGVDVKALKKNAEASKYLNDTKAALKALYNAVQEHRKRDKGGTADGATVGAVAGAFEDLGGGKRGEAESKTGARFARRGEDRRRREDRRTSQRLPDEIYGDIDMPRGRTKAEDVRDDSDDTNSFEKPTADYTQTDPDIKALFDGQGVQGVLRKHGKVREELLAPKLSDAAMGILNRIADPSMRKDVEAEFRANYSVGVEDAEQLGGLTYYEILTPQKTEKIYKELQARGIPFVVESIDIGNLGGLNTKVHKDQGVADGHLRAVFGDWYVNTVNKFNGVIAKYGGDEFATLWVGYDTVAKVEKIRGAIEEKMRYERHQRGLGDALYPKSINGRSDVNIGALHSAYGFVLVPAGSKASLKKVKSEADGELNEMKKLYNSLAMDKQDQKDLKKQEDSGIIKEEGETDHANKKLAGKILAVERGGGEAVGGVSPEHTAKRGNRGGSSRKVSDHRKSRDENVRRRREVSRHDDVNPSAADRAKHLYNEARTKFAKQKRPADHLPATLSLFNRDPFTKFHGTKTTVAALEQILNKAGWKEADVAVAKETLAEYKERHGAKSFPYDDFETDVRASIVRPDRIVSGSYSNYGLDRLPELEDIIEKHETIILNFPGVEHGTTGHFASVFDGNLLKPVKYEILERDGTYFAVDKNRPDNMTEENIAGYVGTAGNKEAVEAWVKKHRERVRENGDSGEINKGLFGHFRIWTDENNHAFIAEIQSDFFQKKRMGGTEEHVLSRRKGKLVREAVESAQNTIKARKLKHKIDTKETEATEIITEAEHKYHEWAQANKVDLRPSIGKVVGGDINSRDDVAADIISHPSSHELSLKQIGEVATAVFDIASRYRPRYKKLKNEINRLRDRHDKIIDAARAAVSDVTPTSAERQFIASEKTWGERILREAIRYAAEQGALDVRLPSPYAVALIEGYIEQGKSLTYDYDAMPYKITSGGVDDMYDEDGEGRRLYIGDTVEYDDGEYMVIEEATGPGGTITARLLQDTYSTTKKDWKEDEIESRRWREDDGYTTEDDGYTLDDDFQELVRSGLAVETGNYYQIWSYKTKEVELHEPNYYGTPINKDNFEGILADKKNDALEDWQRTVLRKYSDFRKTIAKEYGKENIVTTEWSDVDWYTLSLSKAERKPVTAFARKGKAAATESDPSDRAKQIYAEARTKFAKQKRPADHLPVTLSLFNRDPFTKFHGTKTTVAALEQIFNKAGWKEADVAVAKEVLEQYKERHGAKSFPYDDFETDVRASIVRPERITSDSYSNYGLDKLPMLESVVDKHETVILNFPGIEHGEMGHFGDVYSVARSAPPKYEIIEREGTWFAVDKNRRGVELTEGNIANYVGTAGTKESVEAWVKKRNKRTRRGGGKTPVDTGLFGHFRIWTDENNRAYIAEIQSDFFQNNAGKVGEKILDMKHSEARGAAARAALGSQKAQEMSREAAHKRSEADEVYNSAKREYLEWLDANKIDPEDYLDGVPSIDMVLADESAVATHEIIRAEIDWRIEQRQAQRKRGNEPEKDVPEDVREALVDKTIDIIGRYHRPIKKLIEEYKKLADGVADIISAARADASTAAITPSERQFIASEKTWGERILREAIRYAAEQGASEVLLPSPYAVAVIEGYVESNNSRSDEEIPYQITHRDVDRPNDTLVIGDIIEYKGEEYIIIEETGGDFDHTFRARSTKGLWQFTNIEWNREKATSYDDSNDSYAADSYRNHYVWKEPPKDGDIIDHLCDPGYYAPAVSNRNFEEVLADKGNSALEGWQRTVLRKYAGFRKTLAREYGKENIETVNHTGDADWYSLDLSKIERKPVTAFAKKRAAAPGPQPADRNLVAVHNLDANQLLSAIELGGFAMPSIAVTKKDIPHDKRYGDVSLIFGRETIDPAASRRNKVYGGDAYTPTFPQLGYMINKQKLTEINNRVNKRIDASDLHELSEAPLNESDMTDILRRSHGNPADKFKDDGRMIAVFFMESGESVKPVTGRSKDDVWWATRDALRKRVNSSPETVASYQKWLKGIFDGIVVKRGIRNNESWHTQSGNRRGFNALHWDVTLNNIVKAMRREEQKGGDGIIPGPNNVAAAASEDFKSVAEMRKASGRIVREDDKNYAAIKEGHANRFYEITGIMNKKASKDNQYRAQGDASKVLIEIARAAAGTKSPERAAAVIYAKLQEYETNFRAPIKDKVALGSKIWKLLRDMRNMPTEYFEAKPRRAVGIDEIKGAVIPSDAAPELTSALEKHGVPYVTYDKESEGDRSAKVKGFAEDYALTFARKVKPAAEAGIPEKYANDERAKRAARKAWEEKGVESPVFKKWFDGSKVVGEDGKPLVVYHGARTLDNFTTFNGGKIFFTDNEDIAEMFRANHAYKLIVDGKEYGISETEAQDIIGAIDPYQSQDIDWGTGWNLLNPDGELGSVDESLVESFNDLIEHGGIQSPHLDSFDGAKDVRIEPNNNGLYEVYLDIKNPKIIDMEGKPWDIETEVKEWTFDGGYDGIIVKNVVEGGGTAELLDGSDPPAATNYIVKNPSQVKSATDNVGTFDEGNPDIRFARQSQNFRDAHGAPSMDSETLAEALENGEDTNLSEVLRGKHKQPDDYFGPMGPKRFGYDTPSGRQVHDVITKLKQQLRSGTPAKSLKAKAYRAVPNDVDADKLVPGDWVSLSKLDAVDHGESRFGEGEYKIIEQDVPLHHIWWDGMDVREWGYDPSNNTRFARKSGKGPAGLPSMEEARRKLLNNQRKYLDNIWDAAVSKDGGDASHPYPIGRPTPELLSEIGRALNRGVSAKKQLIRLGHVRHINKRHGEGGAHTEGQVPVTKEMFALIPDILKNFDTVERGHKTRGGDGVLIRKKYSDGSAVVVDAVPSKGNLEIRSFWVDEINDGRGRTISDYGSQTDVYPGYTSKTHRATPTTTNNINDPDSKVNTQGKKNKTSFARQVKPASEAGIPEKYANDERAKRAARKAWKEKGVESPVFKRWFGDSKVVGEDGKPLVVYHGSRSGGFSVFDNTAGHRGSDAPDGTSFFTASPEVARSYSGTRKSADYEESSAGNYAVYLNIKNPYEVDFNGADWQGDLYGKCEVYLPESDDYLYPPDGSSYFDSRDAAEAAAEEQGYDIDDIDIREDPYIGESTNSVAADAKRMGYDGAIIRNVVDYGGKANVLEEPGTVYIAFEPTQIKSATDNVGTFDGENPDIRFARQSKIPDYLKIRRPKALRVQGFKLPYLNPEERALQQKDPRWKIYSYLQSCADDIGFGRGGVSEMINSWGSGDDPKVWTRLEDGIVGLITDNEEFWTLFPGGRYDEYAPATLTADDVLSQVPGWEVAFEKKQFVTDEEYLDPMISGAQEAAFKSLFEGLAPHELEADGWDGHYSIPDLIKMQLAEMNKKPIYRDNGRLAISNAGEEFSARFDKESGEWVVSDAHGRIERLPPNAEVWIDTVPATERAEKIRQRAEGANKRGQIREGVKEIATLAQSKAVARELGNIAKYLVDTRAHTAATMDAETNRKLEEMLQKYGGGGAPTQRLITYFKTIGRDRILKNPDMDLKYMELNPKQRAEYMTWVENRDSVPPFLQEMLDEQFAEVMKTLSSAEIFKIGEDIAALKDAGRATRMLELVAQMVEREREANECIEALEKNKKFKIDDSPSRLQSKHESERSVWEHVMDGAKTVMANILDPQVLARTLDGNLNKKDKETGLPAYGPFERLVDSIAIDAYSARTEGLEETLAVIDNFAAEHLGDMLPGKAKKMMWDGSAPPSVQESSRSLERVHKSITNTLCEIDIKKGDGTEKIKVSHDESLFIYAHSQNDDNNAHLLASGYSEQNINEVIEKMPQGHKDFVDAVIDHLDNVQFDRVNDVFLREHLIKMNKVERYFMIRNLMMEKKTAGEVIALENAMRAGRASVKKGMTKSRLSSKLPFKEFSFFGTLLPGLREAEQYIAYNDAVRHATRLLNHKGLRQALEQNHPQALKHLEVWLETVARGKPAEAEDSVGFAALRALRSNVAVSSIGFSVMTWLKQLDAYGHGILKMGSPHLEDFTKTLSSVTHPVAEEKFARENSAVVRNRLASIERHYQQADAKIQINDWWRKHFGKTGAAIAGAGEAFDKAKEMSMWGCKAIDYVTVVSLWNSRYKQVYREISRRTGCDAARAHANAKKWADKLIIDTQQVYEAEHRSTLFGSDRHKIMRLLFGLFKGQQTKNINVLYELVAGLKNDGGAGAARAAGLIFAKVVLLSALMQPLWTASSVVNPDDDDWEDFIDFMMDNYASGYPLLGDVAQAATMNATNVIRNARGRKPLWKDYSRGTSPTLSLAGEALSLAGGEKTGWVDVGLTTGRVLGVPGVSQGKRTKAAVEEGDWRRALYSKSQLQDKGVFAAMAKRVYSGSRAEKMGVKTWLSGLSEDRQEAFKAYYREYAKREALASVKARRKKAEAQAAARKKAEAKAAPTKQ